MNRKKSLTTSIKDFFSSQLGIFVLGAIITSLLIPWFFQVWQDYQKELEIKSDLVGQISESVTRMIMSTQFFFLNNPETLGLEQYNKQMEELNSDYRDWEIASSVIDSQLKAYFPHTSLSSDWGSLKAVDPRKINKSSSPLAPTFSNNVSDFYAKVPYVNRDDTQFNFGDERQKLLLQKDKIIQRILDSPVSSFASNPFQQIFKGLFSQR
jgi:hypothetical protein